jgi:5'-nucleotidase
MSLASVRLAIFSLLVTTGLSWWGNVKTRGAFKNSNFQRRAALFSSSEIAEDSQFLGSTWIGADETWIQDSNSIEYISGPDSSFEALGEDIGLNISSELIRRNIIPQHLTSGTDLFCNRELNMQQIESIGFDMDWTIAQYNRDFDLLAYNGAIRKLIDLMGYPEETLTFEYRLNICSRGCIIDYTKGNILKLDNHRYVRAAEHGLTRLSKEEMKSMMKKSGKEESFTGPNFVNIDTPFSLVDACLYAQLVDLRDKFAESDDKLSKSESLMVSKTYTDLWKDLRKAIDRCHKDGVIKDAVARDPAKYIEYDPNIFPMMDSFRKSGRKVFLLTNSDFGYTQVVMNYLFHQGKGGQLDLEWTEYFDLVVVLGNKPAFLIDEKSLSFYQVIPNQTGNGSMLAGTHSTIKNIECFPGRDEEVPSFLEKYGKIYQGGNAKLLQTLLQIPAGDAILYVGDHIYSDILRSKRTLGWRTCLIVPELTKEIKTHNTLKDDRKNLRALRRQQDLLEGELDVMYRRNLLLNVASGHDLDTESTGIEESQKLREELKMLKAEIESSLKAYDQAFHPKWGQLLKAGLRESRISMQIKDYACLFTSRASNLGLTSPQRPFRPPRDFMPHDFPERVKDLKDLKE